MSQVPAGWFSDPLGRYELRYWDGANWTEHVLRGGIQGVDAINAAPGPDTQEHSTSTEELEPRGIVDPEAAPRVQAQPPAVTPVPPGPPPPSPPLVPGPAYMSVPAQASVAGLAVASLVLGIVWIYWIGSILAIIFGHIALRQIRKSNGWKTGRGLAIAGVVLGYVGVAFLAFFIVVLLVNGGSRSTHINTDLSDGHCDNSRFLQDPDC